MNKNLFKSVARIGGVTSALLVATLIGLYTVAPIQMRLSLQMGITESIQSIKNAPAVRHFKRQLKDTKRIDFTDNLGRNVIGSISDPKEIQQIVTRCPSRWRGQPAGTEEG